MANNGELNFVKDELATKRSMQEGSKLNKVEANLAKARALIREAMRSNVTVPPEDNTEYIPQGHIYRNAFAFHRYERYM